MSTETATALGHVRVLDLTRVLAGPWCSQNLADLGAEVIKIERPGGGDDTRGWGPPWIPNGSGQPSNDSGYYASANRGKRSVTVDLARPEGQQLIRQLVAESDVLVENFKVGDLKRYGLDYASLREVRPDLIYCSVTGFGQEGPSAHRPGYDFIFQGLGGLMSVTGERDDRPGGGPQKVGVAVADVLTGMYATVAILAALNHRQVSGRGQYIDMALLDCIVAFGGNQVINHFISGNVPGRFGNAHASLFPYEVFHTADGHIIVAVGNEAQWRRFCTTIGLEALGNDPRYASMSQRLTARTELLPQLAAAMLQQNTRHWLTTLEAADVACGPINNYREVFEDPQVQHRGLRVDIERADGGRVPTIASPLRLAETPVRYQQAPPLLGEHTDVVLTKVLGLSPERIAELRAQGII